MRQTDTQTLKKRRKEREREMVLKPYLVGLLPFAAMVMVECFDVGLTTLSKAAMSKGMSHFVFVVYSNALATLILLPSSFLFHRTKRPPLNFSLLCKFFFLSLIGMEKVDLRRSRSRVKIMGTLVSISGALIVTLYKGPSIGSLPVQSPSIPSEGSFPSQPYLFNMLANKSNWILGGLFLVIACLSLSIWNTSQAVILKGYPSELTIVAFYCLFGTIQCTTLSFFAERNIPNAWKLSPDIELISVIYSAVLGSAVTYSVQTWCIHKKGPVFVAMFKPLGIAIAALLGVIFLGDTLHIGTVIGAIVIVVGFYGVIWAQSKEEETESLGFDRLPSSSHRTPLLQTHMVA